jgi:polyisoprenoid-binding protein YceI
MRIVKTFTLLSFLVAGVSAHATDWQLDNEQSQLNFISTKKGDVAEVHQFDRLTGSLSENGAFTVDIDLESVNTNIDIRDQRMREFLFNVVEFPAASLSAQVDPKLVADLSIGMSQTATVAAELSLHGQTQKLSIDVMLTKLSDTKLMLVSAKPLVLNVSDFELVQGVEKLRELAGLPSISHAVPISFYLTLNAM